MTPAAFSPLGKGITGTCQKMGSIGNGSFIILINKFANAGCNQIQSKICFTVLESYLMCKVL